MRHQFLVFLLVALATTVTACSTLPSPVPAGTSQSESSVQPAAPASTSPTATSGGAIAAGPTVVGQSNCPITPPSTGPTAFSSSVPPVVGWYANDSLWAGRVGSIGVDRWTMDNKVAWWRKIPGILVIEGRRLDAPALSLLAHVPEGYGPSGFQSTSVTFPSSGCWEVVGYLVTVKAGSQEKAGEQLRFVVRVE